MDYDFIFFFFRKRGSSRCEGSRRETTRATKRKVTGNFLFPFSKKKLIGILLFRFKYGKTANGQLVNAEMVKAIVALGFMEDLVAEGKKEAGKGRARERGREDVKREERREQRKDEEDVEEKQS